VVCTLDFESSVGLLLLSRLFNFIDTGKFTDKDASLWNRSHRPFHLTDDPMKNLLQRQKGTNSIKRNGVFSAINFLNRGTKATQTAGPALLRSGSEPLDLALLEEQIREY